MQVQDYEAQRALADLIDKATLKRHDAVDQELLYRIKRSCRHSEDNIRNSFGLLYERLKKPHSQVRLLALEIIAELFHRSAAFRALLAPKFPRFLVLVLGFRSNEPLPPPIGPATQLRERALQLIEKWNKEYGSRHPQISLGYSYIKETLKFEFPQLDALREAEEVAQREREARAQQLAQERYNKLLEEWPAQSTEHRALLRQFDEAFTLLEAEAAAAEPNNDAEEDGGGVEWEDVAEEPAMNSDGIDGLSAYAPVDEPSQPQNAMQASQEAHSAAMEAVIETLYGLYKLISNQALKQIQEVLRIIVRADAGQPGEAQHTQRERLLRAATSLKSELAAAKERFEGAHLDLAAMAQAQQRRRKELEKQEAGAEARRRQEQRQQHQTQESTKPFNPYHFIKDPAAPQKPFVIAESVGNMSRQRREQTGTGVRPCSASSLPESVRQSLAARAPVISGAFVNVWDSGSAVPQYVSGGAALDVSNHWGTVNVHQELPAERLEEMFLYQPKESSERPQYTEGSLAGGGSNSARTATNSNTERRPSSTAGLAFSGAPTAEGRRAQRAQERAYNDAVISGVDVIPQELLNPDNRNADEAKKKAKKRQGTAKERLAKKLLSKSAVAAAFADSTDRERGANANRWENK